MCTCVYVCACMSGFVFCVMSRMLEIAHTFSVFVCSLRSNLCVHKCAQQPFIFPLDTHTPTPTHPHTHTPHTHTPHTHTHIRINHRTAGAIQFNNHTIHGPSCVCKKIWCCIEFHCPCLQCICCCSLGCSCQLSDTGNRLHVQSYCQAERHRDSFIFGLCVVQNPSVTTPRTPIGVGEIGNCSFHRVCA